MARRAHRSRSCRVTGRRDRRRTTPRRRRRIGGARRRARPTAIGSAGARQERSRMLRTILDARALVALIAGGGCRRRGVCTPIPIDTDDVFLALIELRNPIAFQVLGVRLRRRSGSRRRSSRRPCSRRSLTIVVYRHAPRVAVRALPPYPSPEQRAQRRRSCSARRIIDDHDRPRAGADVADDSAARPLHGVMILGAVGTGKTSACMYPVRRPVAALASATIPTARSAAWCWK